MSDLEPMIGPDSSVEILRQASALYRVADADYRNTLLDVGRRLHDYVLAYLREADGLSAREAEKRTRQQATANCAEALGTDDTRVCRLIVAHQVKELLADGGNVGQLSFTTILRFGRLIRRRVSHRGDPVRPGRDGVSRAVNEIWEVNPQFGQRAVDHFREAVRRGLNGSAVRAFLAELEFRRDRRYRSARKIVSSVAEGWSLGSKPSTDDNRPPLRLAQVEKLARVASPRDVAEAIWEALENMPNARSIVAHLTNMVPSPHSRRQIGA